MPTVLVPFRADGAERDQAWAHLSQRWAALGWEVVTGSCPDGPWVKALAVQDALSRASGDVLVIVDADVWVPGVRAAVGAVESGAAWAVPHTLVHRLTAGATGLALRDGRFDGRTVEQRPYPGMIGGGCVVLRRDVYESCPLDPRFRGWGQEDAAWGVALTALHGPPWRSTEPLWHLWHPPMDRVGLTAGMARGEVAPPRGTGSLAGRRLLAEYVKAADGGRMREFLAHREVETREPTMWKYRNRNDPDKVHEFPTRNARLDRLGNWELIEQPAPQPLREDDFRRALAPEPASVPVVAPAVVPAALADRPVETVNLPYSNGGFLPPVVSRSDDSVPAVFSGGCVVAPDATVERVGRDVLAELNGGNTDVFKASEVAPADDSDLTARPSVRASVAEWRSYGRTAGLGDRVDDMTKAQLIDHYRQ